MRKILNIAVVLAAVLAMTGCKPSVIEAQTEAQTGENGLPYGVYETHETMKYEKPSLTYVIPEGAKGPADSYVEGDEFEFYPEDRKPQETEALLYQVKYFYINSEGLVEDFDVIEGSEVTAEDLIDILVVDGCLAEGTELVSFEQEGDSATVTLSQLEGQYAEASGEQLAQAVANTFTDNLILDTVTVRVGEAAYGPLEYVY